MRVFIDTNVLLDAIVARSDIQFTRDAAAILTLGDTKVVELYMSVLSVPTIAYVLKNMSAAAKKDVIRTLTDIVNVLPSLPGHISNMLDSSKPDIEDALQAESAREGACDLILTRNAKTFAGCGIPAVTPQEFLRRIQ